MPFSLEQTRNARLSYAEPARSLGLRPAFYLHQLLDADHYFRTQFHDFSFGRIETKIDEYVATALDVTNIVRARIGFFHGFTPINL